METEIIDKRLSVILNVKEIQKSTSKKPASITFEFSYPAHLKCSTDLASDLINKLMPQFMGGEIKIKDLCLTWFEEDE